MAAATAIIFFVLRLEVFFEQMYRTSPASKPADLLHCSLHLLSCRRPMPLTPLNECGVPKFVCTTLRPSLPAFPELHTLEGCAKFVSEFLTYEPLEEPLHPPSHMPSPMSVLSWQAADSFDAAGVLCSLLLGAGYNAFVVMGYAPLTVTLNDQSSTEYVLSAGDPLLSAADAAAAAAASAASGQKQQQGQGQPASASNSSAGRSGAPGTAAGSSGPGSAAASGTGSSSSSKGGGSAEGAAGDDLGKKKKYVVRPKPQLASKYLQEHGDPAGQSEADDTAATSAAEVRQSPTAAACTFVGASWTG
jgi:hypothetical protein